MMHVRGTRYGSGYCHLSLGRAPGRFPDLCGADLYISSLPLGVTLAPGYAVKHLGVFKRFMFMLCIATALQELFWGGEEIIQ